MGMLPFCARCGGRLGVGDAVIEVRIVKRRHEDGTVATDRGELGLAHLTCPEGSGD